MSAFSSFCRSRCKNAQAATVVLRCLRFRLVPFTFGVDSPLLADTHAIKFNAESRAIRWRRSRVLGVGCTSIDALSSRPPPLFLSRFFLLFVTFRFEVRSFE